MTEVLPSCASSRTGSFVFGFKRLDHRQILAADLFRGSLAEIVKDADSILQGALDSGVIANAFLGLCLDLGEMGPQQFRVADGTVSMEVGLTP